MHGRGRCRIGVALLAMVVGGPAGAEASAVIYEFGGVVTAGDPSAGVAAGMRFSGTFSLDPRELGRGYGFKGDQSYSVDPTASPASESMTVSFAGGPTSTLPPGSLGVDVWEQGLSGWGSPSGKPLTGTDLHIIGRLPGGIPIQIELFNPGQTLDPTLAVPSPIRLGDYPTAQLQELAPSNSFKVAPGTPVFVGTITSLEPMATPEPTTLLVLGPALAGWLALRRSRADQPTHREG